MSPSSPVPDTGPPSPVEEVRIVEPDVAAPPASAVAPAPEGGVRRPAAETPAEPAAILPPPNPEHFAVSSSPAAEEPKQLGDVFFDFDRFSIRKDARTTLEANADVLKAQSEMSLVVEGHCDERGSADYNILLGERRARAVKRYLEDLGINTARIQITSFGKERPFCHQRTEECWQKNRRAHLVVKQQ